MTTTDYHPKHRHEKRRDPFGVAILVILFMMALGVAASLVKDGWPF